MAGRPAIRDVQENIDTTFHSTRSPPYGRGVGNKGKSRAIGPLADRFDASDGPVFSQSHGHWAILVAHGSAVRPIQTPHHAPFITTDLRRSASQIGCSLVEGRDQTSRIGRVDSNRQCVQENSKAIVFAGKSKRLSGHGAVPTRLTHSTF